MTTKTFYISGEDVPEEVDQIEQLFVKIGDFGMVMGILAHFVAVGISTDIAEGSSLEEAIETFVDIVKKNLTIVKPFEGRHDA